MSTREAVRAALGRDVDYGGACALCGCDWAARWIGMTELRVCRRCALEILPRLAADAIWQTHLTRSEAERALEHMAAEFWRALFIRQQGGDDA
jgi:hypothetical protein